jgi:hypothetical protein
LDPIIAIPDSRVAYEETFTIHKKPTPKEIIDLMAHLAKFLNKFAVELLRDDNGPAIVSAANPAPNAVLQSSATLETAAIQFAGLVQQQQGLIGGAQVARGGGPQRMN